MKWITKSLLALTLCIMALKSAAQFTLAGQFGQEMDFIGNYSLNKQISFEAGYGGYFSTSLLVSPSVKNVPNAQTYSNWAYLSINIRPEFSFK